METQKKLLRGVLCTGILFLFALVSQCQDETPLPKVKRGFLLTAPGRLLAGTTEKVCIHLNELEGPLDARLRLFRVNVSNIISETEPLVEVTEKLSGETSPRCLELPLESLENTDVERAALVFNISSDSENYNSSAQGVINIQQFRYMTIIQTDKNIYQPGQMVRFRVMTVDQDLKPLMEEIPRIILQDPNKIHMQNWRSIPVSENTGMAQFEYQLLDETPLGTWKITVMRDPETSQDESKVDKALDTLPPYVSTKAFEVEEYVLPKFSVEIKGPDGAKSFLANQDQMTVSVCAKFTTGRPVTGATASVVLVPRVFNWQYGGRYLYDPLIRKIEDVVTQKLVDVELENGCVTIDVDKEKLGLLNSVLKPDSFHVRANITRIGLGDTQGAIQEFFLKREAVDIRYHQDGSSYDSTFKPGIPTQHEVLVKHTITEQPVEGEEIQVCPSYGLRNTHGLEMGCRNLTSDQEGKVRFTLPPLGPDVNGVYFSMKSLTQASVTYPGSSYTLMHQPSGGHSLRPSASPSNSALEIISNKAKVDCGEEFQLNFVFIDQTEGERDTDFTVQLSSRGNILFSRKVTEAEANPEIYSSPDEPTWPGNYSLPDGFVLRKLSTSFPVTPEMSPDANLLVFYSRPDGEVVSDAVKLTVNPCFQNKVSVSWDREESAVKEEATLTATASPASTCGLRVVDESLLLLRPGNRITPDTISKYLQRFVPNRWEAHRPWEYCISIPENDTREVPEFHAEDAREAFEDVTATILTDLDVATRICRYSPHFGGDIRPVSLAVSGDSFPQEEVQHDAVAVAFSGFAAASPPSPPPVNTRRDFFPETFLFDVVPLDDIGEATVSRSLPDTITTWVADAVCISPEDGIGVSEKEARITVFQNFFVEHNVPYSVKRGEIAHLRMAVHNGFQRTMPVRVSLDEEVPGSMRIVEEGEAVQSGCVAPGASAVFVFNTTFAQLGEVPLVLSAQEDRSVECEGVGEPDVGTSSDTVRFDIRVIPEGVQKEKTENRYMCGQDGDEATFSLALPEDIVEGSERAFITVSGDLLGPSLENIENLVSLPFGCGEQNMVRFTPNIFVLKYLKGTEQLTRPLSNKISNYMRDGYQRQLRYVQRYEDGSFSAFGSRDPEPSIWLTAFVLKSFAAASEYIDVDQNLLQNSVSWIAKNIDPETGCFQNIGTVHHQEMKGGAANHDSSVPLTAYILAALYETKEAVPSLNFSQIEQGDDQFSSAINCLKKSDAKLTEDSTYDLALKVYTYVLTGEHDRNPELGKVAEELEKRKIEENGTIHWETRGDSGLSLNVETTAYALLALMKMSPNPDIKEQINKGIRWLVAQRNTNGGFVSTQDTVLALQALSSYAAQVYGKDYDLQVTVTGTGREEGEEENIQINNERKMLLRTLKAKVPSEVKVKMSGQGCAIVQSNVRFNVESEGDNVSFALELNPDGCSLRRLDVCVTFLGPEQESNQVILEAQMPSGIVPDEFQLAQEEKKFPNIRRSEIVPDSNTVNIYFESLSKDSRQCLTIPVSVAAVVDNKKPAVINVYDYYCPCRKARAFWDLEACNEV